MLFAICGNYIDRMHWHEQWMDGGTTIERFYGFIDAIMSYIELDHPGRSFVITMDNLNPHKNLLMTNRILIAGTGMYSVPPTGPWIEPLSMSSMQFNQNMDDLRNRINLTVGGIHSFHRNFEHVGFPILP